MSELRSENVVANSPKSILERIELDGVVANVAAITNVRLRFFEYDTYEDAARDTGGIEIGTVLTYASADCMFNTLQKDAMWNRHDARGYNCSLDIPANRVPNGGTYVRVEIVVQPSAGGAEPITLEPWILYLLPSAID